jgi:hypothetical protein
MIKDWFCSNASIYHDIYFYCVTILSTTINDQLSVTSINQSTEGAEFVWVSECQKGEGCEIINQFVFV